MASIRSKLIEAARSRELLRVSRRFETTPIRGHVLDVGPRFFLLGLVSDRIRFDGFECLRVADVRSVAPDPHAAFVEAALKKRKARRPKNPGVSVQRVADMVDAIGRVFPLVSIHREEVDRNVCWIGRVLGVQGGRVSLLQIDPSAEWKRMPSEYRLAELTRLTFGGDYEGALHLVGGKPEAG
jgi:hypothetical protein